MSIPVVKVSGSPREMGRQYGKAVADKVHALAEERLKLTLEEMRLAGVEPDEALCLQVAQGMLAIQEGWSSRIHEEFMGIAEGARIDPARLLIGNGFTDFKDVVVKATSADVTECTSLFVLPESTTTGRTYAAQTWDMHATAEPYIVIVERHPDEGPGTLSLTTAGCLSLIGVNEWGLAIGNNNLTPEDAQPGVIYLAMIHAALMAPEFGSAVRAVTDAPRASGHHYYLVDAEGHGVGIETTAKRYRTFEASDGLYGHANHYRDTDLAPSQTSLPNSLTREDIATQLLSAQKGAIDSESLRALLQNRDGEPDCICRYGEEPITGADPRRQPARTCAAAVLEPSARGFWAVWGPPNGESWEWHELTS